MTRHPIRTCIGCRRRASSEELVRLVESAGDLVVSRTATGRGAWLCSRSPSACLELALQRNALSRALRTAVAPYAVRGLSAELAALDTGVTRSQAVVGESPTS